MHSLTKTIPFQYAVVLYYSFFFLPFSSSSSDDQRTTVSGLFCGKSSADPNVIPKFVEDMQSLSLKLTTSRFATQSLNSTPSIFALIQCHNDLSPSDCQLCYAIARTRLPHCLPSSSARIFLDGCFIRYETYEFYHESVSATSDSYSCSNDTVLDPQFGFRVSETAARVAARKRGFGVAEESGVHALAQCWESLGKEDCRVCLEKALREVKRCVSRREGRAMNTGCYLRYSDHKFYNGHGHHKIHVEVFALLIGSDRLESYKPASIYYLNRKEKISLINLQKKFDIRKWSNEDRMRYAYINVISGLVLGRDGKAIIPEIYMKVVMDKNKIESYPWGVKAFKLLVDSVFKAREKLVKEKDCNSYVLDGLTYALQIWIMEAIPDFGILMGIKINKELIQGPRCSNWTGVAKASFEEISQLESAFGSETVMYPYISSTGNYDVFDSASFVFSDEFRDCRVNKLNKLIRSGYDWSDYIWGVEESAQISENNEEEEPDLENAFVDDNDEVRTPPAEDSYVNNSRRTKKKQPDHGAEARKRKLLCQRLESKQQPLGEDMKALLQSLFAENFSPMKKRLHDRLDQMETEIKSLKETINLAGIKAANTSKAVNVEESQPKRQVRTTNQKKN